MLMFVIIFGQPDVCEEICDGADTSKIQEFRKIKGIEILKIWWLLRKLRVKPTLIDLELGNEKIY